MTCGSCSIAAAWDSRWNLVRNVSLVENSSARIFSATVRPLPVSYASYTTPPPPLPSRRVRLYLPNVVPTRESTATSSIPSRTTQYLPWRPSDAPVCCESHDGRVSNPAQDSRKKRARHPPEPL